MKSGTMSGLCYLGRNVSKSGYVYLRFVPRSGGGAKLVRPVVLISEEEMKRGGLSRVLNLLRSGAGPECEPVSFLNHAHKAEMLKLKREHELILLRVLQGDTSEMKIIPLHARRGWQFDRFTNEVRVYPLPKSNEDFVRILTEAFEIASC